MNDIVPIARGGLVDQDAVEIGDLYDKSRSSIVNSVQYAFQCGGRLAQKKAALLHGSWLPWLKDNADVLGFESERTAQRLIGFWEANTTPASDLLTIEPQEALRISRKLWGHSNTIATKHTGDPESYTPGQYIEAARLVMGEIDLDPASNDLAQETVQALKWYDEENNGLLQPWHGRVFLNPPYSYPSVEYFVLKLLEEYEAARVSAAILLTNDNSDTKWWHAAARAAGGVCHTLGRINFYKSDGEITQPTNGQSFFYFGDDSKRFHEIFSEFGLIMVVAS